jgi:hypothetical protein
MTTQLQDKTSWAPLPGGPRWDVRDSDRPRSGVLVAVADDALRDQMIRALDGAGFVASGVPSGAALTDSLNAAVASAGSPLPEVVVVDVSMLGRENLAMMQILDGAGCGDSIVLILPHALTRGSEPAWVEDIPHLHEPFPMAIFVEEVARLASPRSIRGLTRIPGPAMDAA